MLRGFGLGRRFRLSPSLPAGPPRDQRSRAGLVGWPPVRRAATLPKTRPAAHLGGRSTGKLFVIWTALHIPRKVSLANRSCPPPGRFSGARLNVDRLRWRSARGASRDRCRRFPGAAAGWVVVGVPVVPFLPKAARSPGMNSVTGRTSRRQSVTYGFLEVSQLRPDRPRRP